MVRSFCSKVNAAHSKHMCADGALKLISALEDAALPDEHAASVQGAIDARVSGSTANIDYSQPPPKRASQLILGQQTNYYTAADWAKIRAQSAGFANMATVLINRLVRLGVGNASEQTAKWSVAIMLDVHFENGGAMPTYQSIFMLVEAFKAQIAGAKKAYPHDHIVVYPEAPNELSTDMYGFAYDDDDPPICVVLDRVGNIAHNHVPLRKNSNLLVKEREASEKRAAPVGNSHNIMERLQSFMDENSANRQAYAQLGLGDRKRQLENQDEHHRGSGSHLNRQRTLLALEDEKRTSDADELAAFRAARASTPPSARRGDASGVEGRDALGADCSPDPAKTAEFLLRHNASPKPSAIDFEKLAFDALTSRDATKKQAANDKKRANVAAKVALKSGAAGTGPADTGSDGGEDDEDATDREDDDDDAPPAKKPAAAIKKPSGPAPPMKKPSAKQPNPKAMKQAALPPLVESKLPGPVKDVLKVVFAKGDKRSRAVFTSGAYHAASRVAKAHGVERYRCVAKLAFARAAELFDKRGKN
jgi:hypothetical protein